METPKNITELVTRLVELEAALEQSKRENLALKSMNSKGRELAVLLSSKSRRQSTFTNYEVQQHAKDISDALTKKPLVR